MTQRNGGPAPKRPVDAAAAAAGMDGPPKTPTRDAAHTRLDAGIQTRRPQAAWRTGQHGRPVHHSDHRPRLRSEVERCN